MEQKHKQEIAEIMESCSFDKTTESGLQYTDPLLNQIEFKKRKQDDDYITELESILGSPKSLTSKHTISSFWIFLCSNGR